MNLTQLETQFYKTREEDRRSAAEIAYVLAVLYLQDNNREKAVQFANESIWLFDQCRMETLEDCVVRHRLLAGVSLPTLIHQDVVKERLKVLDL